MVLNYSLTTDPALSRQPGFFYFMAKDPAFLFYYDRFLSGTISMTDEEVGQYIRLMCMQANKGYITKKDMLHICKSYDNDVCLKFANIGEDKFANAVLTEIVSQRAKYTESRRNNRKGKKDSDLSSTYDKHMVNKNKDVIVFSTNKELYRNNKEAFQDISGNYNETEPQRNILVNKGWRSATKKDTDALLFHFLESQVDLQTQSANDIKSHFRRWLNKQPITDLQQLSARIHERQSA